MDLEAEEGRRDYLRKITGSCSVCRINGEACNISQVKALASLLLDIHGQHEHQSLPIRTGRSRFLTRLREPRRPRGERSGRCTRSGRMSERSSRRTNSTRRQESGRQHFTFEINEIDQAELKRRGRSVGNCVPENGPCEKDRGISADGMRSPATVQRTAPGSSRPRAIRELQQAAVYDDALSGPSQTFPILTDC